MGSLLDLVLGHPNSSLSEQALCWQPNNPGDRVISSSFPTRGGSGWHPLSEGRGPTEA